LLKDVKQKNKGGFCKKMNENKKEEGRKDKRRKDFGTCFYREKHC
jgi:hypothetical protein